MWDLRLGDWREALADVEQVDAVICDPPFSARTHAGQRTGSSTRKSTLVYEGIDRQWVESFVGSWAPRCRWWFIIWSDHTAQRWWEESLSAAGWYVFAPVIWLRENPPPRLAGDGPTSAADYLTIARPRVRLPSTRAGSRPGYYRSPRYSSHDGPRAHPGGKDLNMTRALVRDYTLAGDLIVDPCSGGGTTLLAAVQEGRRAVGAEIDPSTHALATERLTERLRQDDLWTRAINVSERPIDQELPW